MELSKDAGISTRAPKLKTHGSRSFLRELSDDGEDEEAAATPSSMIIESEKPWMHGFRAYLDRDDAVPVGTDTIEWWGVSHMSFGYYD
jgi:hypothetical protein